MFNLNVIVRKHLNKSKLRDHPQYTQLGFFRKVNVMINKKAGGLFYIQEEPRDMTAKYSL